MTFDSSTSDNGERDESSGTVSGRKVVLAMFAFGIIMTGALWVYWELYTRPFRPLQHAINAAFPESSPRVIGGRHKSHKAGNPKTLRIVIQVAFDPTTAADELLNDQTSRLLALAAEHLDLTDYEQVEIHLVSRVPEAEPKLRSFTFDTSELPRR